jgi:hypothetical protein
MILGANPTISPTISPMLSEQHLVAQWRELPSEKQQAVIDFVAFLAQRRQPQPSPAPSFQQLREHIITAGIPLLSDAEIDQEVIERRGGYQEAVL